VTSTEAGCIFCGKTPQTKTHVFRKAWVDRLMVPAQGPFEMVHGSGDLTGAARESNWPAKQFDMAPGAACKGCNEGWMDDIDRAAEQIVEPMVIGHKATIRRFIDQEAVARWVTQVVILIDQTQIVQVVPPEIPRRFYADKKPLAGMVIWLARTRPEWGIEAWQRSWVVSSGSDPEPPERPNMCLFTFRIVNLVVQALVPLEHGFAQTILVRRGDKARKFLKQLWPSLYTPVSWPPAVAITLETLEDFARSFEPPGLDLGEWSA
jgi:hypothetical protein